MGPAKRPHSRPTLSFGCTGTRGKPPWNRVAHELSVNNLTANFLDVSSAVRTLNSPLKPPIRLGRLAVDLSRSHQVDGSRVTVA